MPPKSAPTTTSTTGAPAKKAASRAKAKAKPQPKRARQTLLATEASPYYQIWVLTNLTAKPFMVRFGERFDLNLTDWRILLTLADKPDITAQGLADYTGLDKMSVSRVV